MHRFIWDLHYPPLTGTEPEFPMTAIYRDTPPAATSAWVAPGEYTATLTVGGKTYAQPLTVKMDPRVKMSAAQLEEQFALSKQLSGLWATLEPFNKGFHSVADELQKLREQSLPKNLSDKVEALLTKMRRLGPPNARPGAELSFYAIEAVKGLFDDIQTVDAPVTARVKAAVGEVRTLSTSLVDQWKQIIAVDLPALNEELKQAGYPPIKIPS